MPKRKKKEIVNQHTVVIPETVKPINTEKIEYAINQLQQCSNRIKGKFGDDPSLEVMLCDAIIHQQINKLREKINGR